MAEDGRLTKSYLSSDNYRVDGELMAYVTLAEYRSLVEFKASHKSELYEARDKANNFERQFKQLKERHEKLLEKYRALLKENSDSDNDDDDWAW